MDVIVRAVVIGMVVMLAGTMPRNILFVANLRYFARVPWAVPLVAGYLWLFWRYLDGAGPPEDSAAERRASLRAHAVPIRTWAWALLAGGLGIVTLVFGLQLVNRLVVLPQQTLPDLSHVPRATVLVLLMAGAPVAGIVEEAAFRGYMQGPIEKRYGLPIAILITGTMFAVAHLDFTLVLWPYYVAVAAIYGVITQCTGSVLPAIVLHTAGNTYSNLDIWLHGKAEWQAGAGPAALIWQTGADVSLWMSAAWFVLVAALAAAAYVKLASVSMMSPRSG